MGYKKFEQYLKNGLSESGFTDFRLSKPDISVEIKAYFTAIDASQENDRYKALKNFRFHLNNLLDNTNWFLMSERIQCRLGILRGRLKGIDNDADLIREIEKKIEKLKKTE